MEWLTLSPGRRIVAYFVLAIIMGTTLLLLPASSTGPPIGLVDALFTATSTVCVTGLTVLDTGHDFTLFGQIVILVLIQLGGLGIMTFATALLMMTGARLSFQARLGLSQSFSIGADTQTKRLLGAVMLTTFTIEAIGAAALFFRFRSYLPPGKAAYNAVFHSISAFCNAGFSTFSNSLEDFNRDPIMLLIFAGLIIFGGLGFAVINELFDRARVKKTRLSLHSKLCLAATAVLLLAGTGMFYIAEYGNLLADHGSGYSLANAFFQSVTSRTAGFSALPQGNMTEVGLVVVMFLMFIGACPGSTGGGIKTTTFAVITMLLVNRFRGRQTVAVFRRSIDQDSIIRAVAVLLLAVMVIAVMFGLLMFAEDESVSHRYSHGWFVDNLFEMVSAFGTVGLSLGMTGKLELAGKILVILTMFIGRVGLLTLAFSLARPIRPGELVYPDESVMVG